MLNKKEKAVFLVVLEFLNKKKTCLITINQILEKLDEKLKLNEEKVLKILDELTYNDYIEYVVSVSKDKTYYCISLLKKGEGFYIEEKQNKRAMVNRTVITIAFAVLSFTVTLILKAIFS